MHSTTVPNKQRYCRQLQKYVWIQDLRRSKRKITMLGKSEYLLVPCNSRKFCWNTVGKRFQIENAYSSTEKRTILVCVCGRYKTVWKETKHWPNGEKVPMKEFDLGEPKSFRDNVYLGCTQRECQTSKDIVDNYRNMFESKISVVATERLLFFWEIWRKHFLMVLWYGWSRKEMCGAILRAGEQNTPATVQSYNSMPWWPPIQRTGLLAPRGPSGHSGPWPLVSA